MLEGEDEQGNYHFRGMTIGAHMVGVLKRYVEYGTIPGEFLQAVISNDLSGACQRADANNLLILPAYVGWLYNEAPSPAWGSADKMVSWAQRKQSERTS